MTHSPEIRGPVDLWVKDHPVQGRRKTCAVGALEDSFPHKTPQQLESTLNKQIGKTRGIIAPEYTPKAYNPRALGAPTGVSKEVQDVRNAIHNPICSAAMKRGRKEQDRAMLAAKGYADLILSDLEVDELVDIIISNPMPEFDDDSINDLLDKTEKKGMDFCLYVGWGSPSSRS
jgi:hypothetical protein